MFIYTVYFYFRQFPEMDCHMKLNKSGTGHQKSNKQYVKYMTDKLNSSRNGRYAAERHLEQYEHGHDNPFLLQSGHVSSESDNMHAEQNCQPTSPYEYYNDNSAQVSFHMDKRYNSNYWYRSENRYQPFKKNNYNERMQNQVLNSYFHHHSQSHHIKKFPSYSDAKIFANKYKQLSIDKHKNISNHTGRKPTELKTKKDQGDTPSDQLSLKADLIINSVLNGLQVPEFTSNKDSTTEQSISNMVSKPISKTQSHSVSVGVSKSMKKNIQSGFKKSIKNKASEKTPPLHLRKPFNGAHNSVKIQSNRTVNVGDRRELVCQVTRMPSPEKCLANISSSSVVKTMDLSKLVNDPRSHKDRVQVARLLQTQKSRFKHASRPKLDLTLSKCGAIAAHSHNADNSTDGESPASKMTGEDNENCTSTSVHTHQTFDLKEENIDSLNNHVPSEAQHNVRCDTEIILIFN